MGKEDKTIKSIVEEYKMSMGGSFFNNTSKDSNMEIEKLMIEKGIENHLFEVRELLSIYDKLSEYGKRAFFQKIVLKFIKSPNNNE